MITKVAVIGSGVMGHGIAQLYALAGYPVAMYDVEEKYLQKAWKAIADHLSLLVQEGIITEASKQQALNRITSTTDLAIAVQEADFITEAIPEVIEMKWELYEKLERLAKPNTIIASNTSTFPIARLAEKMATPHRMIITHFFNPAQLVPLVEIVRHEQTAGDVVEATIELMKAIGKSPVLLKKDVPGFIANRLQAALAREAFFLMEQGVAEAADIDLAVTAGPGFRWSFIGPIETADFGGLDTWKRVIDNLAPVLDKSERAPDVIERCVDKGDLGTKTGKGIYAYDEQSVVQKLRERDEFFIRLAAMKKRTEG
ncbi:3-hydroxyacyl-CoA dehydrogenase family protein [Brevibacillus migulae]|uniref:3-hydroxyacyl-CoA dehydrogenase family protein n=1 Tax=Brevibacillus migulae TaxID=1644114 RepID=UPI00106EFDA3|nr:3-hydroxyacyl-CoA dehydrogenase family protein [Brevibacillus migulae]